MQFRCQKFFAQNGLNNAHYITEFSNVTMWLRKSEECACEEGNLRDDDEVEGLVSKDHLQLNLVT